MERWFFFSLLTESTGAPAPTQTQILTPTTDLLTVWGFFFCPLLPPSPFFPCRVNEAADSTLYWHGAQSSSLSFPRICSPFPLSFIDLRPPHFRLVPAPHWLSTSEMTQIKCSIINCWHTDPQNVGKTSHGGERGWGGGGGREDTEPGTVGDRRLLCATTAWLNWVTHTGSNRQTLNIIHQNPPGSLKQTIWLYECNREAETGYGWNERWF